MTSITAKVIADSISLNSIRITTLQLRYPRFIHSELMTHRAFSRNSSSSRAVPVEKLIEDIYRDTAMPIHWGKNQKGMQAREECNAIVSWDVYGGTGDATREVAWHSARNKAIAMAMAFHKAGYHKQIVNRLIEPFAHINVLVTSTSWANFQKLRNHPDAQPEIKKLAEEIKKAREDSVPRPVGAGWHLPYVVPEDEVIVQELRYSINKDKPEAKEFKKFWDRFGDQWSNTKALIAISVARCARVSYLTHDMKKPDLVADLKLYDRLLASEPLHASPAEHQATPDWKLEAALGSDRDWVWMHPNQHGNFYGWRQYRKMLPGEFENEFASI